MKPRLVNRVLSNGTPLVGSSGIDRSLSSVDAPGVLYGARPPTGTQLLA
jgi:hypothetical protein